MLYVIITLLACYGMWHLVQYLDRVENQDKPYGAISTDCRVARRSLLREYRHKRRPRRRPTMLSHLTDEQWQSHMEAFVDYQCSTGKYRDFEALIPQWLESEGLPQSPLVPQYNSSGHLTGWVNTDVSTSEAA
jgi:hypothetical protein